MARLVLLALAGAAGTLARFAMTEWIKRIAPGLMPWGTWAVNLLGCFVFGLIWVLAEERGIVSANFRMITLVGFMGSFTTFSTLAFESVDIFRAGETLAGMINIIGQNIAGICAVLAGMALARLVALS